MSTQHVVPIADLIEHDTDHGEDCICGPSVEAVYDDDGSNGWLISHASLDGREDREDRGECDADAQRWRATYPLEAV